MDGQGRLGISERGAGAGSLDDGIFLWAVDFESGRLVSDSGHIHEGDG
jgi:hypothetical protein